jgi:hypothetical protein
MRSAIFNLDWTKFRYDNAQDRANLAGALQFFLATPDKFVPKQFANCQEFVKIHRAVQEFTAANDGWVNEKAIQILEKVHLTKDWDTGFEQIFDVRDFQGSGASGFDVAGVGSPLTFKYVKPGEKIDVYQASGEKFRTYFDYYGAALGWHRSLFENSDWWTLEDNAIEFRNKAYSARAAAYYALIEAAADKVGCCATIPAGCSGCDADIRSVAKSINFAAASILLRLKDRGYNLDPQNTEFIVLTPIQLRGVVKEALGVRSQSFAESARVVDYSLRQITSLALTNTSRVMVILPRRLWKIGYKMDLTLFSQFDLLSYTDTQAGWMAHGGVAGDLDQIACIEITSESGSCPNPNEAPLTPQTAPTVDNGQTEMTGAPGSDINGTFTPK